MLNAQFAANQKPRSARRLGGSFSNFAPMPKKEKPALERGYSRKKFFGIGAAIRWIPRYRGYQDGVYQKEFEKSKVF